VALNHEFRLMPIFRAVLDEAGSEEAGAPVVMQAWQNMDLPPWKEPGWRGALLTGTLFEAGIHLVDYALAVFGERPRAVSATVSSCGVHGNESDAVAFCTLEFSRGRLANIVQNRLCKGETQYFEVRVDCERASLRASFGGRARVSAGLLRSTRPHLRIELGAAGIAWREQGHGRVALARNPKSPAMAATRLLLDATLKAFADGRPAPAEAADGVAALEVIEACYESARTGSRRTIS